MNDSHFYNLSAHMLSILKAANEMDSTLLITGNTGTGKSHLAQAVHESSKRSESGRWYKINLATLSENIIESELFGHEKGAFTGADYRRIGRLEICNGGTVFLDEIGELSPRLQAKLLDFIQYRKISPVGSNREITLNVRIIAATNKNLDQAVRTGEFRADLFHRINVFHIKLPDLTTNPIAVLNFTNYFLQQKAAKIEKNILGLSRDVEKVFQHYCWPGNLRELENILEFAIAIERSDRISFSSLPISMQSFATEKLNLNEKFEPEPKPEIEKERIRAVPQHSSLKLLELPINMDFHHTRDTFEKIYIEEALRWCGGQINLTSRKIGLNKVSLAEKIRKYKIDWQKIRYEAITAEIK